MSFRAITFVGASLAAVVALSGCSASDSADSAPSAAPTDKVLHLSFLQDPGQPPDPDIFYAGQGLLLTTNLYDGLLQYKGGTATPELEPLLATEWTKSSDNKVFTFTLRRGVKFHDGTPFTAAAVKGSFDRRLAVNQVPAYMGAADTGCWLNMADVNDFMVAQPWLRGVEQSHVVTSPPTLRLAALSVG